MTGNIANTLKKLFWKWDILKDDYQKFSKNLTSVLFSNRVFSYGNCYGNKYGQEVGTSPFSNCQISSEVFFCSDESTDHLWCLNSKVSESFQNLQLIIHASFFMMSLLFQFQLSVGILNLGTKWRIISKIWILQEPKQRFRLNKKRFS